MSRPIWSPHQVRQQLSNRAVQTRTQGTIRGLTPVPPVGAGNQNPTLSELPFQWPTWAGAITSTVSDGRTVRYACSVAAAVIDVTTWANSFTIKVFKNGTLIPGLTCVVAAAGKGLQFPCNPVLLIPYVDVITVQASSPGTGNIGVFVHVELIS